MPQKNQLIALLLAFTVCLGPALLADSIDFTPIAAVANGDGPPQAITIFHKGRGYVCFRVPGTWKSARNQAGVMFSKINTAQANAYLAPASQPIPLTDKKKALAALREAVLATAPANATEVKVTVEPSDGLRIGILPAMTAEIEFTFYGNHFRRALIAIDQKPEVQLQVTITASLKDYDAISQEVLGFLSTWCDLGPNDLDEIQIKQ